MERGDVEALSQGHGVGCVFVGLAHTNLGRADRLVQQRELVLKVEAQHAAACTHAAHHTDENEFEFR